MPDENKCSLIAAMRGKSGIRVRDTEWGFVVQKHGCADRRAFWGEVLALVALLAFGVVAYGQWLWPGADNNPDLLPFKMGATVLFFVLAAWMYKLARTGLTSEIHVDTENGNLGFVRRNKEGVPTLDSAVKFDQIESLFMKRTKQRFGADSLFMNIRGSAGAVLLSRAPAVELESLLERMRTDCRGIGSSASPLRKQLA